MTERVYYRLSNFTSQKETFYNTNNNDRLVMGQIPHLKCLNLAVIVHAIEDVGDSFIH